MEKWVKLPDVDEPVVEVVAIFEAVDDDALSSLLAMWSSAILCDIWRGWLSVLIVYEAVFRLHTFEHKYSRPQSYA